MPSDNLKSAGGAGPENAEEGGAETGAVGGVAAQGVEKAEAAVVSQATGMLKKYLSTVLQKFIPFINGLTFAYTRMVFKELRKEGRLMSPEGLIMFLFSTATDLLQFVLSLLDVFLGVGEIISEPLSVVADLLIGAWLWARSVAKSM